MEPDFSVLISGHKLKYKEFHLKNMIFNYLFITVSFHRLPEDISVSLFELFKTQVDLPACSLWPSFEQGFGLDDLGSSFPPPLFCNSVVLLLLRQALWPAASALLQLIELPTVLSEPHTSSNSTCSLVISHLKQQFM